MFNNTHDKKVLSSSEQNIHSTTPIITYILAKATILLLLLARFFVALVI